MRYLFVIFISVITQVFTFAQQTKPELFILSVGISKYQNTSYNLKFAHKDAQDLAEAFRKQSDLFEVREVKVLINEQATRANIRNELQEMKRKISANDLFLFIFSGHGLNEALVPYDFNRNDRIATTVGKNDLADLINQLNCNYITLIDACHSGSFAKGIDLGKDLDVDFVREQNLANQNLLRALTATDKAHIVIGSSSSSEKSDECTACQNGYFSQAILDAFDGKIVVDTQTQKKYLPDVDKNGFIYSNELDNYLKEAVNIATKNNEIQQSVISRQSAGFNFPMIKLLDTDKDGVADLYDECPHQVGSVLANGCVQKEASFAQLATNEPLVSSPKSISKTRAIGKSLLFPGWGDNTLNQNKKNTWLGFAAYGALSSGVYAEFQAIKHYTKYNQTYNQAALDYHRAMANKNFKWAKIGFATAAALWLFDITKVAIQKPMKNSLSFNLNQKSFTLSLNHSF